MDLRIVTGPAMLVIGGLILLLAYRLWWLHPINRVFRIGPFVTERGLRALLDMRQVFLAIGAFLTAQGAASVVFWAFAGGDVQHGATRFLGSLSAGCGVWAAIAVGVTAYRIWRIK